jgi:hypothetical protein
MKRFLASERARAGSLIVAAALIGGTGCVTAMVLNSAAQVAQSSQQRQQREERLRSENDVIRKDAAQGQVEAMTRLGWFQVSGDRFGVPGDTRGVALLEEAAARQYVPAQYLLGRVLIEGPFGITPQPERGLKLLTLAATKTCTVDAGSDSRVNDHPARTLADIYLKGSAGIPADAAMAEFWMARNAAYCHDFSYGPFSTAVSAGLSDYERRAKIQAWWELAHGKQASGGPTFTPEQMQMTARELERLRQRVRESEAEYPAPPQSAS